MDFTAAIRRLNSLVKSDKRVDIALLPVADGILLKQKPPALQVVVDYHSRIF